MCDRKISPLSALVVLAFPAVAVAGGFFGNPSACLKQKQWSLTLEYAWAKRGVDYTVGGAEQTHINTAYARFSYGLCDDIELYLKLGGAGVDFEDSTYRSRALFAIGGGGKWTVFRIGPLRWGLAGQITTYWDDHSEHMGMTHWQARTGPSVRIGAFEPYFGVMGQWISGRLQRPREDKFEEDDGVALYLGTDLHLSEKVVLSVEAANGMEFNRDWTFAIALSFRF